MHENKVHKQFKRTTEIGKFWMSLDRIIEVGKLLVKLERSTEVGIFNWYKKDNAWNFEIFKRSGFFQLHWPLSISSKNFSNAAKLSHFGRILPTSLGYFKFKQKPSNLKLSNSTIFPTKLSNYTYPVNLGDLLVLLPDLLPDLNLVAGSFIEINAVRTLILMSCRAELFSSDRPSRIRSFVGAIPSNVKWRKSRVGWFREKNLICVYLD